MRELDFSKMLSLYGNWEVQAQGKTANFKSGKDDPSHGLALFSRSVDDGIIECQIELPEPTENSGAFVVFRANGQRNYCAAGLGGWDNAYTLLEGSHLSPTRMESAGNIDNLKAGRKYSVRVALEGQRASIFVDDVKVIDYSRLPTTDGTGVGLLAFRGSSQVHFGPIAIDDSQPVAFIAMQFSDTYDDVYDDAIKPLVQEIGYEPVRVDEISQPGIILNDIWGQITESSVVIAEVTEPNPNVYYEIGVAHALGKPTILLAQRGTSLPFDLGPHRCIFYDNTIPGRGRLLDSLRSSLASVLGISSKQIKTPSSAST